MAHLLSIPENVIIQHLFPLLDHNDLLRLRRVSKQTKAFADTYLWTPKPGHQGKGELKIDSTDESQTLQAFLKSGLPPPPSRLRIIHDSEKESPGQLCLRCSSFFEDDHLQEFMERYSKYITHLEIHELQLPFNSLKQIQFYESLVNLENLVIHNMKTVGGAAQFEEKTRNANGSFLIRPTFNKLKSFSMFTTDCLDTMWNFINGVLDNLEEIKHPVKSENVSDSDDGDEDHHHDQINLVPLRELIERRRLRNQNTILYHWPFMCPGSVQPAELIRLLVSCRDNGVLIKKFPANFLHFLFHDENGQIMGEDYKGNFFVRNIIHSLMNLHDNVFLMEMPALEKIEIFGTAWSGFRIWEGHDAPEWPNLKELYVRVNSFANELLQFLCASPVLMRPKLEELSLNYYSQNVRINRLPLPCPRNLGISCGNLKKLSLSYCPGDNDFFLALWVGLPLLEKVKLYHCSKLTTKGFLGNGERGSAPVFLKLEKLKHLRLWGLDGMPRIGDAAFKKVFRHLKLTSLKLGSEKAIRSITVAGIKQLLTGQCAKTIQKLNLDGLDLAGVSGEELDEVASCFRCSKMI